LVSSVLSIQSTTANIAFRSLKIMMLQMLGLSKQF